MSDPKLPLQVNARLVSESHTGLEPIFYIPLIKIGGLVRYKAVSIFLSTV